eukprot:337460-Amphidinium_carterae.1
MATGASSRRPMDARSLYDAQWRVGEEPPPPGMIFCNMTGQWEAIAGTIGEERSPQWKARFAEQSALWPSYGRLKKSFPNNGTNIAENEPENE